MKLLFDQNLSPNLIDALAQEFPESTHVRDVGLGAAHDIDVLNYANANSYAVCTKDADFADLAHVNGARNGVVLIGIGNASTVQIERPLRSYADAVNKIFAIDPAAVIEL